jgi:hypothetical protein
MQYLGGNTQKVNAKELYYEIIVSKGLGYLTRKAQNMLCILGENAISKNSYNNEDDRNDCLQQGYEALFTTWVSFNRLKGTNAFAYYTEIFKRGTAQGLNVLTKIKGAKKDDNIKMYSINSSNDGSGLHSII